jgi:esterase/lipase
MLTKTFVISKSIIKIIIILLITIYFVRAFDARTKMGLRDEHRIEFENEYSVNMESATNWSDYLEIDARLAEEVKNKIHRDANLILVDRYTEDSEANPNHYPTNWNHSYVLKPDIVNGAAVLLHGLTDSPYSVRNTAELFRDNGFIAYAPRMPGHGFAVGGLRQSEWEDWLSATKIAMREADSKRQSGQPLILFGYSNGGLLAIRYTTECLRDPDLPCPDGVVLLSAAIQVSPAALLANLHSIVSWLPYFEQFQWEDILPEIDPFKFTSFPKKPGWEIHKLVKEVEKDLADIKNNKVTFPATIAFQSLVDNTVNSHAVIKFIQKLPANNHELVIYDVNRSAAVVELMRREPPNLEKVILEHAPYDFSVSLITNRDRNTQKVHALELGSGKIKPDYNDHEMIWPVGVYSLSHIALPFPDDDPIYGTRRKDGKLNLGMSAPRGERGVLNLAPDYFLRLRHNPFYQYQKDRISSWLERWK